MDYTIFGSNNFYAKKTQKTFPKSENQDSHENQPKVLTSYSQELQGFSSRDSLQIRRATFFIHNFKFFAYVNQKTYFRTKIATPYDL